MVNSGINKVVLLGNIYKNGRLHDYKQQKFFHFTLVTDESFKKRGETLTNSEFHNIKIPVFLVEAEIENFNKGRLIYIEGKIQTNSFIDNSGVKRYKTEVWVHQYKFLN
jgi:single-strand DNA-binding protein